MAGAYVIIAHTDMDGVAAAGLYAYLSGSMPCKVLFAEPYNVERVLAKTGSLDTEKIVVVDMGVNVNNVARIASIIRSHVGKGVKVEWYDHHVWDDDWIRLLEDSGAKLYLDVSTCATGVVSRYYRGKRGNIDEAFVRELVAGVCAGDLWRFDHWRGPWFMRLVRKRDSMEWRMFVLNKISQGVLWCGEFTNNVIEKLEREIRSYNMVDGRVVVKSINGLKIAVALKQLDTETSFMAGYILSRLGVDIACIASRDGRLSLRSRRVNVREIAKALGGGGHVRAAGAKISVPLRVRVLDLFVDGALETYIANKIADVIASIGVEKLV